MITLGLLVVTKGYRVRAAMIKGQNRCALPKFHVRDSQNTRDQFTKDRRSKTCVIILRSVHSIHSKWKSK